MKVVCLSNCDFYTVEETTFELLMILTQIVITCNIYFHAQRCNENICVSKQPVLV